MKILWRSILALLATFVLYVVIVLIHGTITDYQPAEKLPAEVHAHAHDMVIQDSVLSLLIWNLGYGGLGAEADFFYSGGGFFTSKGKKVRSPKPLVDQYIKGTTSAIQRYKSDFYLFQEVDYASKRSYFYNQFKLLQKTAKGQYAAYFPNYKVVRAPVPLLEPWQAYGRANSGLGTFARFEPSEATRLQLPGQFSWPTRLFMLDRCLGFTRFKTRFGKDLVIINVHNEAFDRSGDIKTAQMGYLKKILLAEYAKGNYVIAGGDWNALPPFLKYDFFMPGKGPSGHHTQNMDPQLMPEDWHWIYDPSKPTNRSLRTPYLPYKSFVQLIDYFLVSPNLQVRQVKGLKQDFRYSDHEAVWMEVELDRN
jgi:endonuclease/exonuclease/phosphatase family metal-dependent hydrolase